VARPKSTAGRVSYDLRPAKQSERLILVDLLSLGGECGLSIAGYRYVGMGGNRFYDFLLLHRYLGIHLMVSLEHDEDMFKRASFNNPYGFIEVKGQSVEEFLAEDSSRTPTIYWFDYDGGIGPAVTGDIAVVSESLRVGDFCFVTVAGGVPKAANSMNDVQRVAWLQDVVPEVSLEVVPEDTQRSTFHRAVYKILMAAFRSAFAANRDGAFVTLLQVRYADGVPMVTVGGAFLTESQAEVLTRRVRAVLPFLTTASDPYEIVSFPLTDRERVLFDRAVTTRRNSRENRQLTALGFTSRHTEAYRDILRYVPRYVEAIL